MENKYYTPAIEEFHIGFEYEVLCNPTKSSEDDPAYYLEWSEETFYLNESHINLVKYVDIQDRVDKEGSIRVKLLDQQDIEDLGFVYNSGMLQQDFIGYDKDIFKLIKFKNNNKVMIFGKEYITLFEGIIRNKSELKKILQQVGAL